MNLLTFSIFILIVSVSVADFPPNLIDILTLPLAILNSFVKFLWGTVPCELAGTNITPNQVKFYRFDRFFRQKFLITPVTALNIFKCTKVIVHGYLHTTDTPWVKDMANAYHDKKDCQVILVEWPSKDLYPISAENTKIVGQAIAKFLKDKGIFYFFVHIIGHSLGAHAASFAGKQVQAENNQYKIGRISGLDPAGPCFSGKPDSEHLLKSDAIFVDVIHTNGGVCGYKKSFDAVDYFPHGGTKQPGCPNTDAPTVEKLQQNPQLPVGCDHNMSIKYFIDSINGVKYVAYKCSDYCTFCNGGCTSNDQIVYGEYTFTDECGDYYFGKSNCHKCLPTTPVVSTTTTPVVSTTSTPVVSTTSTPVVLTTFPPVPSTELP